MVARFLSGLPHGAYFGVGSLVAASMVPAHRRTWAVSMMITGLTVANIVGVPVTTRIGQRLRVAVAVCRGRRDRPSSPFSPWALGAVLPARRRA